MAWFGVSGWHKRTIMTFKKPSLDLIFVFEENHCPHRRLELPILVSCTLKKKSVISVKSLQSQTNQASPCLATDGDCFVCDYFLSHWFSVPKRWLVRPAGPAWGPQHYPSSFLLACGKQLGDRQPDITEGACNHGTVKTQIQQPQTVWPRHSGGS